MTPGNYLSILRHLNKQKAKVHLTLMPNINVEVKEETLKAVRIQAAVQGVSQREWVEKTLESAVNEDVRELLQQEAR